MLDDGLLAAARDRLWAGNTSATLRRADPATWAAGFGEGDRRSDASGLNDRSAERGWRLRELSGDRGLIELLPRRVRPAAGASLRITC